jgi:hypothetical protein
MELGKHTIIETFLGRLLSLKDSDFIAFLNADAKTIKPFINNLCLFWSNTGTSNSSVHVKFFKFLLRLCPAYNSMGNSSAAKAGKAVIAPKKFIEALFDSDPVGLMTYLFVTWRSSAPELLQIIRDELFPQSLLDNLKKCAHKNQSAQVIEFLEWSCGTKISAADWSLRDRETILKRFEYESDDDLVDEGDNNDNSTFARKEVFDPVRKILLSNYIADPTVFSRTSACRQSKSRKAVCDQTKLSHEQIEGWALMFERNPKKTRIIQDFIIDQENLNK